MNPGLPFTSSPDGPPSQNPLSLMMSQMSKYAVPSSTPLYHDAIKTIATSDDEMLPDRPLLSGLVFLLKLVLTRDGSPPECDLFRFGRLAHDWLLARRLLHHVCFFSCLAAMLFCYSALAVHLSGGRHRRRAGAVRLAFLLTAAFLVCWLPHHLALLLRTLQELGILPQWGCPQLSRLARALGATHILGLAHCGLNPALYAFLGGRFRRELLGLLGRIWGVRRASTSATRTSHSTLR
ncbi:unnamed protein product [Menidia menidia]|uniref:(Atlantic silverside) hypothetical protein n=1 Tax=Menidia menidia TaxID=238744 RepID=A0A8S4BJD6_9TELE|nr:unnamed protein product [Menidia menidia]